jgi:hypothetical protein
MKHPVMQNRSSIHFAALTHNQPVFCPSATWNPDAITFADASIVGSWASGIFVSHNNTVYIPSRQFNNVTVWMEGVASPIRTISAGLSSPYGVLAASNGDVYIDNGQNNGRVDLWTPNATTGVSAMIVPDACFCLFFDIQDSLYCSMYLKHYVIKRPNGSSASTTMTVAGTGTPGSSPTLLDGPIGVVVDLQLRLYVADCGNHRVQRFEFGQLNGTTAVGNGAPGTFTIGCPDGIAFDGDGYLFITDWDNSCIVGSGPNGFRCIAGCTGGGGAASNQLHGPEGLSFDSYGNMFVAEEMNNRIQKFLYEPSSCGE